jgi:hypothetical protein
MIDAKSRRDALDNAIGGLAATPPYLDVVSRLVCLRGVSTLTAFALTVELGDWRRFRPESLGPFLGLTPSEHSSGKRRRQGAITKTGNSHVRRLLIEAAWHQRSPREGASRSNADATASLSRCKPRPSAAAGGCTDAGTRSRLEASRARSSWSPSPASSLDTAGRSQRWSSRHYQRLGEESAPAQRREERPEGTL